MGIRDRTNPIGLDLGAAALKACQRDAHGRVIASLVLPRRRFGAQHDGEELSRLASMLERQGFVGRRVVAACPWPDVISESLRLPPAESGAPRDELAKAEMARLRQLSPGSFGLGFWPIPAPARGGEGAFVMASATTHAQADAYIDLFDDAGLDLVALDTPAGTLCRGVSDDLAGRRGMTLIVDLGHQQARSVVLAEGRVVFERGNDEAGLAHLHDQIVETLALEPEPAELLLRRAGRMPGTAARAPSPPCSAVSNGLDAATRSATSPLRGSPHPRADARLRPMSCRVLVLEDSDSHASRQALRLFPRATVIGHADGYRTRDEDPALLTELA